jgi:hypothetical protein
MVRLAALTVVAFLCLSGCEKAPEGDSDAPGEVAGGEGSILRKFPQSGNGGLVQPTRTVVRDGVVWADLWAKANAHLAPVPKAPAVDFTKEMVAFAALGQRPSAGWSVEVVGVREEGGKLRLLVAEREPAKGSMSATVMTAPWHAVVIAKSDLPVEWARYEAPK